uniref:Putative secreted protein n=1 Tax=Panstrongylus lignarius TaxID=156445 RepID=A0A224XR12_9HEMI
MVSFSASFNVLDVLSRTLLIILLVLLWASLISSSSRRNCDTHMPNSETSCCKINLLFSLNKCSYRNNPVAPMTTPAPTATASSPWDLRKFPFMTVGY